MCENSQSSVDEVISLDDGCIGIPSAGPDSLLLSKKALHQRDADENLFLRFLELDPPIETQTQTNSSPLLSANPRRSSVSSNKPPSNGRTPFTITKILTRSADKGFGFSIVWTHPPRIEKVEAGLPAEKAGILPGDYVVFVDKHNVVTMPELDILNLIKTQGNTLLLEIFRRPTRQGNGIKTNSINIIPPYSQVQLEDETSLKPSTLAPRSSTACSNISIETAKRKLNLPQVTFSKESILQNFSDQRKKFLYQLISREQHFVSAINFGIERFVNPLRERKDIISPNDHKVLFQNIDELMRISDDILEQIIQDETEPQIHFASRVYLSKCTALCVAYKKYCNGLKKADCVLVNKSRNSNCDFMTFISEPIVPRKRPDLTTFIHRPLQHFREILKLMQMIASHCRVDSEEHNNFTAIIHEFHSAYREITVGGGLMEPVGEGRPLLTLQDLESRLVFTKCKPFQLAAHGRQWIFGGDLSRIEGRTVKPYWTLLFSDILLFAKVSRDRVLFITEEPIALSNITDSCFNIRKKSCEFRITIDPNGRQIESPTVHCAPDLTRTPKKSTKKRYIVLRAPSAELKAVWQNLLTRQIFLMNATLGSTPLSSPLESPDILQTLVPISDIGAQVTSMASIKVPSLDSIQLRNQQSIRMPRQIEEFIDEKCRNLNKTGVPKGSALHLAQWMKGQLDRQIIESDPIESETEGDQDWSAEQVSNRSKELKLIDAIGKLNNELNKLSESHDEGSENDDDNKSVSKSTTSDSQITVRSSSPLSNNKIDTISVCRSCHKNCKGKLHSANNSQTSPSKCCTSSPSNTNSTSKSEKTTISTSTLLKINSNKVISNNASEKYSTDDINANNLTYDRKKLNLNYKQKCQKPCNCKCTPKDFEKTTLSPDELIHERVKILNNVHVINSNLKHNQIIRNYDDADQDVMMLIGLAQVNPAATLVHMEPFAVPTISVVPPTPETANKNNLTLQWDTNRLQLDNIPEQTVTTNKNGYSPDNSPEEEEENEPPYRTLNTSLKRYGTMSSLEMVPSSPEVKNYRSSDYSDAEDTEDTKTYNSSEEDSENDIKIVTREVYDNNAQTFFNWTGNFIEESRAFIDRYLGRRDYTSNDKCDKDDNIEGETSGGISVASLETSGEEVWGTPTSGGENDDLQLFGSIESPTKSSSSYTGDDDTELMMDELLMAPPMSASTIRGLLPRRKLEPLFEEDTESIESDDDKPLNGKDFKQGQGLERNHEDYVALKGFTESDSTNTTPSLTPLVETKEMVKNSSPVENFSNAVDSGFAFAPPLIEPKYTEVTEILEGKQNIAQVGLSPRLEMRLALNHDILGDEDLINYSPAPDLTAILGRDLSTYHRMTGKDIIMNRIVMRPNTLAATNKLNCNRNGMNSSFQQNNSKMDTPIPNRKKPSQNTWNNSGFVEREERSLSDLERLARREKVYCMTQLKSNHSSLKHSDSMTKSKSSKFFSFLSRRNSEQQLVRHFSRENCDEDIPTNCSHVSSPHKENDKTLDRRFWKHLTKRRRASFTEISTCST